jgi:hypothetical protein
MMGFLLESSDVTKKPTSVYKEIAFLLENPPASNSHKTASPKRLQKQSINPTSAKQPTPLPRNSLALTK